MMPNAQLILFCHFMQLSSRRRMQAVFLAWLAWSFTWTTFSWQSELSSSSPPWPWSVPRLCSWTPLLLTTTFFFFGFLYFLITITKYLGETTWGKKALFASVLETSVPHHRLGTVASPCKHLASWLTRTQKAILEQEAAINVKDHL